MQLYPSHTVSGPAVHVTYPPASILKFFPPSPEPQVLIPPAADATFARPFNIPIHVYNNALDVRLPLTIAVIYATGAVMMSRRNAQQGYKPWAISKTSAFFVFVVLHNVFLAIYSAWTFAGMLNMIRASWPGWDGEHGVVGVVDALCKLSGPRGLGEAATFDTSTSAWGFTDKALKLAGGIPDNTDVGRIWNEGLAYYGWLFYLSKFYELVDTAIILAKGKRSGLLQTYHHAGILMCMWAGIRYMSPPIWMMVFINSGIHAIMYTYYALTTLSVPVPRAVKGLLTGMQIMQLIFGSTYALAHLFISYNVPANMPYIFTHNLSGAIPAVTSTISSVIPSLTASAGVGSWLKKLALRAANAEGLAENVHNEQGDTFGIDAIQSAEVEKAAQEIRYKLEYPSVNCLDTTGQVFAIFLNLMYLAPLTVLFINFFVRSYIRRTSDKTRHPTHAHAIQKSSHDAFKGLEREIHKAIADEQGNNDLEVPANVQAFSDNTKAGAKRAMDKVRQDMNKLQGRAKMMGKQAEGEATEIKEEKGPELEEKSEEAVSKGKEEVKKGSETIKSKAEETKEEAQDQTEEIKENADEAVEEGDSQLSESKDEAWKGDSDAEAPASKEGEKTDVKHEDEKTGAGEGEEAIDASAYEISPDDIKGEAEEKAEREMQPEGVA